MVTAGPVIDFSSAQMPDWLWLYERDLRSLDKFMSNYLGNALRRYRKRVRRWLLTSASNSAAVLSLGEEELLWLTIKLVQVARQIDPGLELSVGLSQPWGEYMAVEERTHSPFIFADTLIRSELNLSALDVELLMGIASRGSYCRDLLDTSRMLDLYALLGVPLRVTLGLPSSSVPDPHADPELRGGGPVARRLLSQRAGRLDCRLWCPGSVQTIRTGGPLGAVLRHRNPPVPPLRTRGPIWSIKTGPKTTAATARRASALGPLFWQVSRLRQAGPGQGLPRQSS